MTRKEMLALKFGDDVRFENDKIKFNAKFKFHPFDTDVVITRDEGDFIVHRKFLTKIEAKDD